MDLSNLEDDLEMNCTSEYMEFISNHHSKYKEDLEIYYKSTKVVLDIFNTILKTNTSMTQHRLLEKCLNFLRFACAQGNGYQELIANESTLLANIPALVGTEVESVNRLVWQLLSNLVVMCPKNAQLVHNQLFKILMQNLTFAHPNLDNVAAIVYNILKLTKVDGQLVDMNKTLVFGRMLSICCDEKIQKVSPKLVFVDLNLEYFLVEESGIDGIYRNLQPTAKCRANKYITEFVKHQDQRIQPILLNELAETFSKIADSILITLKTAQELCDPNEIMSLLECLTTITSNERYIGVYRSYTSMFINCGALLVASSESKLEEFKPKSSLSDFTQDHRQQLELERDPYYDFKSYLIRLITNLSYKNKKNQDAARDLRILTTVCGSTIMDARNPLMKEWAILAIRNLLEDNLENQKIIAKLTSQGKADNSVLKEFEMENGVLRINKN